MNLKESLKQVSNVTGIGGEEYVNLLLDMGCEYAKDSVGGDRYPEVVANREYWSWYCREWVELDVSFVLGVKCQEKRYREDAVFNAANYKFLKFTTLPRITLPMASLLNKPCDPYFTDEMIKEVSQRVIKRYKLTPNKLKNGRAKKGNGCL